MIVTTHAAQRYVERVDPRLTPEEASDIMLLSARTVRMAAQFGCSTVRIGTGAKLILRGETVVTVLGRRQINRCDLPEVRL